MMIKLHRVQGIIAIVAALLVTMLLAACGAGSPAAQPSSDSPTITIEQDGDQDPQADASDNTERAVASEDQATATPLPATEVTEPTAGPTPAPVATDTPAPQPTAAVAPEADAVVSTASLNVRQGPGTDYPRVGNLGQGTALAVLGKNADGSWLQVRAADGQEGWVAGNLLTVHMALSEVAVVSAPPPPAPRADAVPAPVLRDYQPPTFSWTWNSAGQMAGQNWYFDIQVFQGSGQDPYDTLRAEPDVAHLVDGTWYFDSQFAPRCDSTWVVQIARRDNGRFAGWVSPKSNALPIGGSCDGSDPTPCPNC